MEITEVEIEEALINKKFEFQSVTRLYNHDKAPLKTIKIIFSDAHNRNTFVKIRLQIDAMPIHYRLWKKINADINKKKYYDCKILKMHSSKIWSTVQKYHNERTKGTSKYHCQL